MPRTALPYKAVSEMVEKGSLSLTLNGVFFAAGAIGSYAAAYLADRYGRKRAIQISCLVALIAIIISTASINVAMLLLGRVVQGFG